MHSFATVAKSGDQQGTGQGWNDEWKLPKYKQMDGSLPKQIAQTKRWMQGLITEQSFTIGVKKQFDYLQLARHKQSE